MLKTCRYCGRIHAKDYDCGKKPKKEYATFKKNRAPSKADRFRWSGAWKNKAEEVKRRDLFLCRACLAELAGTERKYNNRNLSVHHIVPLEEAYLLRLDADNLITLCAGHHRQAEQGEIARETLRALAKEPVRPDEHPPRLEFTKK